MKGWVGLVGWPIADGLPTQVVTHQLQVERRTAKAQRPKTDVLPLDHTTKSILVCENTKMESIKFDKKFQLKYIDQPRRVWRSFWSKVFHTWHGRSLSVCHSSEPFNNGSTGWAQGTMYCHFQFQYSHTFHQSISTYLAKCEEVILHTRCRQFLHTRCGLSVYQSVIIHNQVAFSALTLLVERQEGHLACKKMGGWWRWALVSLDRAAPSRMVGVSASVNFPLHHSLFWHWLTRVVPEKGP